VPTSDLSSAVILGFIWILIMSTFKIPPTYAEYIMNALSAAAKLRMPNFRPAQVLQTVKWMFTGGTFGDETKVDAKGKLVVNVTSGTVLPNGMAHDLAKGYERSYELPGMLSSAVARRTRTRGTKLRERDARAWASIHIHATAPVKQVITGMPAVYAMTREIHERIESGKVKYSRKAELALMVGELMVRIGGPAAGLEMNTLMSNAARAFGMMRAVKAREWRTVVDKLVQLEIGINGAEGRMNTMRLGSDADDVMNARKNTTTGLAAEARFESMVRTDFIDMPVSVQRQCLVVKLKEEVLVLPKSDFHKVIQLVTGMANVVPAAATEVASGTAAEIAMAGRTVEVLRANLADLMEATKHVPIGREIELAKAFKDLVAVYKSRISGKLAKDETAELEARMKDSDAYKWFGRQLDEVLARCMSLTAVGALNAIKVFRLLPPPDVSQAYALYKRWTEAAVRHEVSPESIATFKTRLKEVMLSSYVRKPGVRLELRAGKAAPVWWAAYQKGRIDQIPFGELDEYLAWEGSATMPTRSSTNPAVWKDSGLGADTLREAEEGERAQWKTNMLLRLLFDPKCPMPDVENHYLEEISGTLLKPESHKERIAYSNHLASRQKQSRCEEGVDEVMKYHPAFAIKKTGVERDERFDEFSKGTSSPDGVALWFSFDVKGWSANMPWNIQVASHEVWDELYGGMNYRETTANHVGSTVYVDNAGFFAWYKNPGANFEGYNGKEMTALHIAIMTEAGYRLRAAFPSITHESLRIMLMSYIDDGVARIEAPKKQAIEIFAKFKEVVIQTWAEFGFTIEIAKSFPSDRFFEFLNEAYYAGRHLAHGVKSAMRITADPFEEHETLPMRVSKLCSGCRGSAESGLESIAAHCLQAFFVANEVANWIPKGDPMAVAWWCFVPVSMGGLGVPDYLRQNMNASGAAVEESLGTLRAWARVSKSGKVAYLSLLKAGYSDRPATVVLNAPLGLQKAEGVMTLDYMPKEIIRGMKRLKEAGRLTQIAKSFLNLSDPAADEKFARRVIPVGQRAVLQEQVIEDLKAALPTHIAAAFTNRFANRRTFAAVAGIKALRDVRRKAKAEAFVSYGVVAGYVY